MNRRDFLKSLPVLSAIPLFSSLINKQGRDEQIRQHPYDAPDVKKFGDRWQEIDFYRDFNQDYRWIGRGPASITFTPNDKIILTVIDDKGNKWISNNGLTWEKYE